MKNKFNTLSISIASVIGIVIYQFLKYIKYEKIDISMLVGYLLGNVLFLIFFYIKFKKINLINYQIMMKDTKK